MTATAKDKFLRIGAFGILILIALFGCSKSLLPPSSREEDALDDPSDPEGDETVIEFAAMNKSGLSEEDLDTAFNMCRSLMEEYYNDREDPLRIDLTRYITDPNLLKYSAGKLKSETHKLDVDSITVNIRGSYQEDDSYFLFLVAKVTSSYGGMFSEGTHFLVRNLGGRLVIADWFVEHGVISPFDSRYRGDDQGVTNPTIWEDPGKVDELLKKAGIQ